MKYITLILATLTLAACGTQQPKENTTWPIEPRNEQVEYLLMLDSLNREYIGDNRNFNSMNLQTLSELSDKRSTPEEMEMMLNKTFDEAEELWHKFILLCNEGREEEAIKLYRDNHKLIDLAVTDSEIRLHLHDEVIGVMAYDLLPEDEACEFMIECFQFDFAMIGINLAATGNRERYGDLYDYSLNTLDSLYSQTDHYGDMITYIDRWIETLSAITTHPAIMANAETKRGDVYKTIGDYTKAISSYNKAKQIIEQAIADGETHPVLQSCIELLDTNIAECHTAIGK